MTFRCRRLAELPELLLVCIINGLEKILIKLKIESLLYAFCGLTEGAGCSSKSIALTKSQPSGGYAQWGLILAKQKIK